MALPPFDDAKLAAACTERCAEFGDPPCFEVEPGCDGCTDCLRECGIEISDPIDENAAVGRLI